MARAIQHDNSDIFRTQPLGLSNDLDVVLNWSLDVNLAGSLRANSNLIHVEHSRRVVHGAAVCSSKNSDRVRAALCHQSRAVNRVNRDVNGRALAVADLFAVEQHRSFVLFALANNNDTVHSHGVDELTHGIDGSAVALFLLTTTDPLTSCQCSGLSNSDELHRKVAIWCFRIRGVH